MNRQTGAGDKGLMILVGLLLLGAGCGTRVVTPEAAVVAPAAIGAVAPSATGDAPVSTVEGQSQSGTAGSVAAPAATGASTAAKAQPSGQPLTAATTRATTQRSVGDQGSGQSAPGQSAPGNVAPVIPPPGGGAATPATGSSPIIVASVGTYSGPGGVVFMPIRRGAELWVKAANAKGGVNGHPVKLIIFDNGADPAKHRSQVQEAVERHHVISFLANSESLAGEGSVDYVNEKRVPIVGTDGGEEWAYRSPMYFLQASNGSPLYRTWMPSTAGQMLPKGKKRLGAIFCVEAPACRQAVPVVTETAPKAGMELVYRADASITQPDFTAECLAARNQNVDVFLIVLDQNSVERLVSSCARQGYRPTFNLFAQVITDEQKNNRNLTGAIGSTSVLPYFQTGTPAADEFQSALRLYGKGIPLTTSMPLGWVAGKLLERAASTISEPPTSASLLEGLWSLKADTLGGITGPLTFTRDQPPPRFSCWFDLLMSEQGWASPDRFALHCL